MTEILQNKENFDKIEFCARDGAESLGRIAGYLAEDTFVIDELDCADGFTDGLVRAILNLMTLHGIDRARFDLPERTDELKRLGFVDEKPVMESIAAFFDKPCGRDNSHLREKSRIIRP